MFKSKSFLTMDCGANTLKAAEFEPNESGGLRLKKFALYSMGLAGSQDTTREEALTKAMNEILARGQFSSKKVNICAPGYHVFSKFVKLPPVDSAKITQIIQFEAQQNVPFPLEEVAWDYQIVGTSSSGDFEVLLVAIKSDVVESLFRCSERVGLVPQIVDVSTAALSNAFRFNYGELEDCTMLLDIGAKTSNLLFFEKGKFYSRSINIGAHQITQEFAAEARLPFAEAERIKIEKGFVSLGGAYEEPDDPQAAAISKIARQVMTRLHIQVNQTIQFYKRQQGGADPVRMFLSGGASIMPYTAQFFSEKLNIPVEYFNPFRNVEIAPTVNLEELANVAHCFGEVVGLALRNLAHCPVEMNLMPQSVLRRQEFNQKKPFFVATMASVLLVVFAYGFIQGKILDVKRAELEFLDARYTPLYANQQRLERELKDLENIKLQAQLVKMMLENKNFWPQFLPELRQALIETENSGKSLFSAETGVWIEKMITELPPPPQPGDPATTQPRRILTLTNMPAITNIILTIRGVDMSKRDPAGNTKLAFTLLSHLQERSYLVDTNETKLRGTLTSDTNSFTTEVNIRLKDPIPL